MSKLGKILLWVAVVGAAVAVVFGVLLNMQFAQTKINLTQSQQAKAAADQLTRKAQAERDAMTQAKNDSDAKVTAANAKIDDLNTQLAAAQKASTDAATALATATDKAKAAQDALDAINTTLGGQKPEDILAAKTKAESDTAAAQSELKIIQDQYQQSQNQITQLEDSLKRSPTGTQPPGISGRVTFVDHAWNFVILDVGLSKGVVPNGELIVYRNRTFLGKVRVTKADPNDSVAEILPDVKGNIQVGDSVLN